MEDNSMASIYVDVHTPGNGKKYELQLNDNIIVSIMKQKIVEEIFLLEENNLFFDDNVLLCNASQGQILPDNVTLSAAGVKSGHNLLLI
jgi:hypothetical protein